MLVAPAAVAALGYYNGLRIGYIGNYSAAFRILNQCADRYAYDKVGRFFARAAAAAALFARLCRVFALVAEVRKGRKVTVSLENNISAPAAVAAVGSACRNIFLPVKGNSAVAAVARF